MRPWTAPGIRSGLLCRVAGRQCRSISGRPERRVSATSSGARAPQPMTSGGRAPPTGSALDRDTGAALLDQLGGRLDRDRGVAAVRVRADRLAELLVQRSPADEDDVVVADAPLLELAHDDLHVRHR